MPTQERQLEEQFIAKLSGLKYEYREDIRDRATLEQNFRAKFEALNRVTLTPGEFSRLLEEIITPDVFTAARTLRERSSFTRALSALLDVALDCDVVICRSTIGQNLRITGIIPANAEVSR